MVQYTYPCTTAIFLFVVLLCFVSNGAAYTMTTMSPFVTDNCKTSEDYFERQHLLTGNDISAYTKWSPQDWDNCLHIKYREYGKNKPKISLIVAKPGIVNGFTQYTQVRREDKVYYWSNKQYRIFEFTWQDKEKRYASCEYQDQYILVSLSNKGKPFHLEKHNYRKQ